MSDDARTVSPAQRRALAARDRQCRFPGCGNRRCDAHHVEHWADGGRTALDNLVLLCRRHHRAVHEEGFRITRDDAGGVRFARPGGRLLPAAPPAPDWAGEALKPTSERLAVEGSRSAHRLPPRRGTGAAGPRLGDQRALATTSHRVRRRVGDLRTPRRRRGRSPAAQPARGQPRPSGSAGSRSAPGRASACRSTACRAVAGRNARARRQRPRRVAGGRPPAIRGRCRLPLLSR